MEWCLTSWSSSWWPTALPKSYCDILKRLASCKGGNDNDTTVRRKRHGRWSAHRGLLQSPALSPAKSALCPRRWAGSRSLPIYGARPPSDPAAFLLQCVSRPATCLETTVHAHGSRICHSSFPHLNSSDVRRQRLLALARLACPTPALISSCAKPPL